MRLFDPFFYEKAHLLVILVFTISVFFSVYNKNARSLLSRPGHNYLPLIHIYAIVFILVVGLRPISAAFGDTVTYARTFDFLSRSSGGEVFERDSLFYYLMWLCSQFMSVNMFFLILEVLYVVPIVIACSRFMKNNSDIGLLFCLAAFSFFTYGTNGLRNGVSLSLVLLAMTLIGGKLFQNVLCALFSVIAVAIHASAALPVICMLVAYFVRKPRIMFIFWGLSIVISLIAGNSIASFFASLGFDDRLSDYILVDVDENLFSHVGFRWDFLLYSAVPVLLGWYVVFKKKVYDKAFLLLLGTYIYANAFWIMVIRAEYSNRFAYLSWFLYPIVIAYPLLRLDIWPKTQGRKCAVIMAGHYAFSFLMSFVV